MHDIDDGVTPFWTYSPSGQPPQWRRADGDGIAKADRLFFTRFSLRRHRVRAASGVVLELMEMIPPAEQTPFLTRSRRRAGPITGNTLTQAMSYFARRTTGDNDAAETWWADPDVVRTTAQLSPRSGTWSRARNTHRRDHQRARRRERAMNTELTPNSCSRASPSGWRRRTTPRTLYPAHNLEKERWQ